MDLVWHSIFKQPKIFYYLFFVEVFERFSFYGMQAILTLYISNKMSFSTAETATLFTTFTCLMFGLVGIGGYLSDRVIGIQRATYIGISLLMTGYIMLAINANQLFYQALSLIIVGNALFKANPSNLLARAYSKFDYRFDGAFTLFYMSVNLGSFLGMYCLTFVIKNFNWSLSFLVCAVGALISLSLFALTKKHVVYLFTYVEHQAYTLKKTIITTITLGLVSYIVSLSLIHIHSNAAAESFILLVIFGTFVMIGYHILKAKSISKRKLFIAVILMLQTIAYFSIPWQNPNILNLFSIHNTKYTLFDFELSPTFSDALLPALIFLFAPILAFIYNVLAAKGKDATIPTKFSLGIIFCALSYLVLAVSKYFANSAGLVSSTWQVASYTLQAIGELLVSGLGLAMIARLAPRRLTGFMMGSWFLMIPLSILVGKNIPLLTSVPTDIINPTITLNIYSDILLKIGVITLLFGLIFLVLAPKLSNIAHILKSKSSIKQPISSSMSKRLAQNMSFYLIALMIFISVIIFTAINITSRDIYKKQISSWLSTIPSKIAPAVQNRNFEYLRNELILLKSTSLFANFYIMDANKNVIALFDNKHVIARKNLNQRYKLSPIDVYKHSSDFYPIQNTQNKLVGYYQYESDFNFFFVPFLWLCIFCIVAIFLAYVVFKRKLFKGFQDEFNKFDQFLLEVEKISKEIKTTNALHLPIRETNYRSDTYELIKINETITTLIDHIKQITEKAGKEKLNTKLYDLARQVVHDIRSPVAALNIVAQTATELPESKKLIINNAISRINDIADNLLATQKNNIRSDESNHLLTLVSTLIDEKRVEIQYQDIRIQLNNSDHIYTVFAKVDASKFKSILSNIINNAIEAEPKSKTIQVTVGKLDNKVSITIKDDGKGMPANIINKLGKEKIQSTKETGTGIGIYNAKQMLQAWQGELHIFSEQGVGTSMTILLPTEPTPVWFLQKLDLNTQNIVVIDDDPTIHALWKERLKQFNTLKLIHFIHPDRFNNWYHTDRNPDLAYLYLCDYNFTNHRLNGLNLIQERHIAKQSILVTTAIDDQTIINECTKVNLKVIPKSCLMFVNIDLKIADQTYQHI